MLILAILSLLAVVCGQGNGPIEDPFVSATDIEELQADVQGAQLVPQLLPTFDPQGILRPNPAGSGYLSAGNLLNQSQVSDVPNLYVQVGPSSTDLSSNTTLFSIIMVDAGPVGTDETTQRVHWLLSGATLHGVPTARPNGSDPGYPPWQFVWDKATTIVNYTAPAPTPGSGPHRYVIMAYLQTSTFTAPPNIADPATFSLANYLSSSKLGPLVVANYFQVQNGTTTTTSIPTTTSVDTKTLSKTDTYVLSLATSSGSIITETATPVPVIAAARRKEGMDRAWRMGAIFGSVGVLGTVLGAGLVF